MRNSQGITQGYKPTGGRKSRRKWGDRKNMTKIYYIKFLKNTCFKNPQILKPPKKMVPSSLIPIPVHLLEYGISRVLQVSF